MSKQKAACIPQSKHGKSLSWVFDIFICICANDMPSFTGKPDDVVFIGACSLFKTANYRNQKFSLCSYPCNTSSSTSMVQPSQEPREKQNTGRVPSNTSTNNRKRKWWRYLQTRVQKPLRNILHFFNLLILSALIFFWKGSGYTSAVFTKLSLESNI